MLKTRLTKIVEEFFAIGGNHDLGKYREIREKLLEFLREEEFLLAPYDDENTDLAKDIIRYIDANIVYAQKTNVREVHRIIEPFLKRMFKSNEWNYYELKLVISSVHLTKDIEQAVELATRAEERMMNFKHANSTYLLEGCLSLNMCARIVDAKYFVYDVKVDLTSTFEYWMNKLISLVERNKDNKYLEKILLVTKIREGIFEGNTTKLDDLCDELSNQYDKQIGAMIRNEVEFYVEKIKKGAD